MYIRNRKVTCMKRDVFNAIADPTRRSIINLVAREQLNLNAIAAQFPISRPAISKHIRILTQCGLVTIRKEGRERFCEARLGALHQVSDWVLQYEAFWTQKLDALGQFLTTDQKQTPASRTSSSIQKRIKVERIGLW